MNDLFAAPSQDAISDDTDPAMPLTLGARIATLCIVIIPFLGILAAIMLLWRSNIGGIEISLLIGMYLLTVLGITVGFHRLFTHRAFQTGRTIQALFVILGSMAVQGSLWQWVAFHRRHHQFSDHAHDPHSPYHRGQGITGVLQGAWHAHIGWFFVPNPPELHRYVKDISKNRLLSNLSALFPVWVALGLLIPALLGGWLNHSWKGAFLGLLWGGLVRIFLVHHVTWSINSVCHLWGRTPHKTKDRSRNNVLFGILGLGEGWHNNHHAFPVSARHGLKWWQVDISYYLIQFLGLLGLAWKIKLPVQSGL